MSTVVSIMAPIFMLGLLFGPPILAVIGARMEREQRRKDILAGVKPPNGCGEDEHG